MNNSYPGKLKVTLKDEKGWTLTEEYGMVIEETNGNLLAFDRYKHPEYGNVLMLNNEVFFLKFWKSEDLQKLLKAVSAAVTDELEIRNGATSS